MKEPTVLREKTRVSAGSDVPLGTIDEVPPAAVLEMPPGTIPKVAGEAGDAFTDSSWMDSDFVFD